MDRPLPEKACAALLSFSKTGDASFFHTGALCELFQIEREARSIFLSAQRESRLGTDDLSTL